MAEFDEDELVQLSFLRDEETDALIQAGLLGDHERLSSPLDGELTLIYEEMILKILAGPTYPACSITVAIENINLPSYVVDKLRRQLRDKVAEAAKTNNIDNWRKREEATTFGIFEPIMAVFHAVRQVVSALDDHRSRRFTPASSEGDAEAIPDKDLWFLSPDAKQGVHVHDTISSTRETAYKLLGMTPSQIASRLGQSVRVLHVEQVLRADQAAALESFRGSLRKTLARISVDDLRSLVPRELRTPRASDMIEHVAKTRVSYHGTLRQNVPGIVRHGFLAPGRFDPTTGENQSARCGSTYGRGIYSSPSPEFALSYSGQRAHRTSNNEFFGLKLLVCATVLGRARKMYREDGWRTQDEAYEGADSHIANDDLEYIVFDSAQTIPVYVVHLDWGADNSELFANVPEDRCEWAAHQAHAARRMDRWHRRREEAKTMCPGDKQRAKEAVYAKAAKYFPYGFGPATGSKFVVEEVGEVSEDEEEYGQYQDLLVQEREDRAQDTNFWSWVKASEEDEEKLTEGAHEADEYGNQRVASRVPEGFGKKASAWDSLDGPGEKNVADESGGYGLEILMNGL